MIDVTRSRIVAVTAPAMLAILEVFHPHPHDLLNLDLTRWMAVHYAQLALFPLAALVECSLAAGAGGLGANLCRIAMFVFAVSSVAFDTAAGLVTGVLVHSARTAGAPEAWRAPIMAVWDHAVIGGSSDAVPVLAVLGTMAWLVGSVAASVTLRGPGQSWLPTVALNVSAFGLFVFRTHGWPGGPLTLARSRWLRPRSVRAMRVGSYRKRLLPLTVRIATAGILGYHAGSSDRDRFRSILCASPSA